MLPDDILELVHNQPFRPFRIVMNSGKTYEVRHPEWVKVGLDSLTYYEFPNPDREVYERFHLIGLPGRVVSHARRLMVRLGGGAQALATILDARARIRALAPGPAG